MDNGALGHVAANLHRQFVPPSAMGPEEAASGVSCWIPIPTTTYTVLQLKADGTIDWDWVRAH